MASSSLVWRRMFFQLCECTAGHPQPFPPTAQCLGSAREAATQLHAWDCVGSLMQIHVNGVRPAPLKWRWDLCLCQVLAPTRSISITPLDTGCLEDSETDIQQLREGKLFKWECRKNGKVLTL